MSFVRSPRRARRGVTLLEIAIVIAIVGLIAAIGAPLLNELLPSWRTRRAAKEFTSAVNMCRQMAVAQGVEYRVVMMAYDSDVSNPTENAGAYLVQRGNSATLSSAWDTLPVDLDGTDSNVGEGTVNLARGEEDEMLGVSIADWGTLSGSDSGSNDIVCSPRGWLENPATDFDANGYVRITFVNKPRRVDGVVDDWSVLISRGGMARMESSRMAPVGGASGTSSRSAWTTMGSSSGYSP